MPKILFTYMAFLRAIHLLKASIRLLPHFDVSTSTIAVSATKPTEIVSAISEILLRLKRSDTSPQARRAATAERLAGMAVTRRLRRKKDHDDDHAIVIANVNSTSRRPVQERGILEGQSRMREQAKNSPAGFRRS